MKCEDINDKLVDFLDNTLNDEDQKKVLRHVKNCQQCKEELATFSMIQSRMGKLPVPEPDEKMHRNFYAMLDSFKQDMAQNENSWYAMWIKKIKNWQLTGVPALAYSFLILMLGIGIGLWVIPESKYNQKLDTLSIEMQQMKQMMMFTLLEQPSATDRLKAVSISNELKQANEKVFNALLKTLNYDPNVNVRLVSAEALAQMADNPKVREGLIKSITLQDSPLVQVALADIMVDLQEKRSVVEFRKLLQDKQMDEVVKGKIKESIEVLI